MDNGSRVGYVPPVERRGRNLLRCENCDARKPGPPYRCRQSKGLTTSIIFNGGQCLQWMTAQQPRLEPSMRHSIFRSRSVARSLKVSTARVNDPAVLGPRFT